MSTSSELHTAVAAREAAPTKYDAAVAALARGKEAAAAAQAEVARLEGEEREWIARDARRRVERAVADAGPAPALVPTDKAFLSKRKAEVTLAAELQAVATLDAAEREARKAFAAAQAAAEEAAREVLFAEVRADFQAFRQQARELAAVREHLFAMYLGAGRAALTPREWIELDTAIGCSSDVMGIGSPWLEIPIRELEQTGGAPEVRVKAARARIDGQIGDFEMRLAELVSGESGEPRAAQDAA